MLDNFSFGMERLLKGDIGFKVMKHKKRVILVILDGWGIGRKSDGNAIALADMPILDKLKSEYPVTALACSGNDVGLPQGTMGNSEVGHLNIHPILQV